MWYDTCERSVGEPGDCSRFADAGGERHEPFVICEFLRFLGVVQGHIFLTPLRVPAGRQNPETFTGMNRRLWTMDVGEDSTTGGAVRALVVPSRSTGIVVSAHGLWRCLAGLMD